MVLELLDLLLVLKLLLLPEQYDEAVIAPTATRVCLNYYCCTILLVLLRMKESQILLMQQVYELLLLQDVSLLPKLRNVVTDA